MSPTGVYMMKDFEVFRYGVIFGAGVPCGAVLSVVILKIIVFIFVFITGLFAI